MENKTEKDPVFPKGFQLYAETLCTITSVGDFYTDNDYTGLRSLVGSVGMYSYYIEWAFEFEQRFQGREWDGEWNDEVVKFVEQKLKEYE